MGKRIVICADGTWNRPEQNLKTDFPTNVLKLARAIKPVAADQSPQQVFYDWGVGSYYGKVSGGATGKGLHKNIMDGYRYIVQNYSHGDEIFLFGFSRGAYTVRCLCGMIYNCGILKKTNANLIQKAFDHYKKSGEAHSPRGEKSVKFRNAFSHRSRRVKFVGVWDTVGAMGIPFSFLGLLDEKDEFYDNKIGPNVRIARHALAIDEFRYDFEPTIWSNRPGLDLKQVWFAGAHCDVGGSYKPDNDGALLSDIALDWMMREAMAAGLAIEQHLSNGLNPSPTAKLHKSRRNFYRARRRHDRIINHGQSEVFIHQSVKQRWDSDSNYRPQNLDAYITPDDNGTKQWPNNLVN